MRILALSALALALLCSHSLSAEEAALTKLKTALTDIQALTAQKLDYSIPENRHQLKTKVEAFFSPEHLSRRALGRGWRQLSAEQQAQFVEQFINLLITNYAKQLQESGDADVIYGKSQAMGKGRIEIATQIRDESGTLEVLYRMIDLEGNWQVYDVIIEGVSLVSNYRSQFSSVLQRHGPEGLLEKLSEQLDSQ